MFSLALYLGAHYWWICSSKQWIGRQNLCYLLRRKNGDHDNATDACDGPLDAKSQQSSQTQLKRKAQMYLSPDNGPNVGDLVSEKPSLLISSSVIDFLSFYLIYTSLGFIVYKSTEIKRLCIFYICTHLCFNKIKVVKVYIVDLPYFFSSQSEK